MAGQPLQRWDRFANPIVCFDWRHPLTDHEGNRLADEPLPDDYAALWIGDVQRAKFLACETFGWLENFFTAEALRLIDICFFIDQSGGTIYGEISPDCMRVRTHASDDAEALDKDQWRSGGGPSSLSNATPGCIPRCLIHTRPHPFKPQGEFTMSTLTVKNTRAKVSPGGVITLPVSARKTLGMKPKAGARVTVSVKGSAIVFAPATTRMADSGYRRAGGVRGEALRVLEGGREALLF